MNLIFYDLGVTPSLHLVNIGPRDTLFYAQGLVPVVGKVRMSILTHFRIGVLHSTLRFLQFSQKLKMLQPIQAQIWIPLKYSFPVKSTTT